MNGLDGVAFAPMFHGWRHLWRALGALVVVAAIPATAQAGFAPGGRVLSEGVLGSSGPVAVIDSQGDTVVAWVQEASPGSLQIAVRRIAAGGALGPVTVVSAPGEKAFSAALAVAPDGSVFVAWMLEGPEAALNSVSGRWVQPDGTMGPVLPILGSSSADSAAAVHVVVSASGVATVAWYDEVGGKGDRVELQRITPIGEQSVQVNTTLSAGSGSLEAAPLASGATLLASDAVTDVVGAEGVAAAPVNASTSGGASSLNSGLALDGAGEGLLAWRRGAMPGAVIARRLNATGLPIGSEIEVEPETASFVGADESVAANAGGRFLVGWYKQDMGNIGHGYVRAVTLEGLLPDTAHAVTEAGKGEPTVALDDAGSGVAAMSFRIGETATTDLIGSALDLNAAPLAPPLDLSEGGELPSTPALASEPAAGVASAVFAQTAAGTRVIVARRFMEPPTCASSAATVVLGKPVAAPISCNGIGVSSIHAVTPPLHGTLGAFGSSSVTYTPTPGYQGADGFTYVGENEGAVSAPATVSIAVGAAPTSPTPLEKTPPTIRSFKLRRARTRASHGKPRFAYFFQLSYSEPATVRITIERPFQGTLHGKSCRPRHGRAHGRRCTLYRRVTTLASSKLASSLKLTLSGKLERELARLGSLRASAVATDAAGERSRVRRLAVRIATL